MIIFPVGYILHSSINRKNIPLIMNKDEIFICYQQKNMATV